MVRTKSPSTLLLEQFKRQAYHSLYENGCTLVQFASMMDKLFKEYRDMTKIELQVSYNQWQTRKRAWDDEWKIAEGGPSSEARCEMDKLPIWFETEKDVSTQTFMKRVNPTLSEETTKSYLPYHFGNRAQPSYQPDRKGIDRTCESQVPIRAFSSDILDFDHTEAPTTKPFQCQPTSTPKWPSYHSHDPTECLKATFIEGVLPSEQYLGPSNSSGGQNCMSAPAEEFDTSDKYPIAHHNSMFNSHVSDYDYVNFDAFSRTVNNNYAFHTGPHKCEDIQYHNEQAPWHSASSNRPKRKRQDFEPGVQDAGLHSYGGRF